jgi:phage terminase large subunit-like protein
VKLSPAILRAIRSGPVPKLRNWRKLPINRLTRAERAMRFIEAFCLVPEGTLIGKPVVLLPFEEVFFYAVYDSRVPIRNAILSIARKNGKTAVIAMLLLVHLVGPEARRNTQIVSGARSREQASQVYNYAAKMVGLSPQLSEIVRPIHSAKKLLGLTLNVEYRALAAEGRTAHGLSPVVAILDELGQVEGPTDHFVDAITTAQGAHENPLLCIISTQAATDADMLSILIDDATNNRPDDTVCHVYAADEDCELDDRLQWEYANPAIGVYRSEKDMIAQVEKAQRMPSAENTVRNLCFNQRISVISPFISRSVWENNAGIVLPFGDSEVWAGLDLSARTDLTAMVLVGRVCGVTQLQTFVWTAEGGLLERARRDRSPYDVWVKQGYLRTTPGATVDFETVASDISAIVSGLNLRAMAFDRWRIDQIQREFVKLGVELPMIEWGQGFKDMAPAMDAFEAELMNAKIAHGGHPVLTMCMSNARVEKDAAGNRKLSKAKATGRIDAAVAAVMAFGAMSAEIEDDGDMDGFLAEPIMGAI